MLAKRRIGLLGGSFNPAHAGHLHISKQALKRLRLDEVWWLVSPQNPLKSKSELADYDARLESAEVIANDSRIRVLDIEAQLDLRYTVETITLLKKLYPQTTFVWLMGADNLAGFHRWRRWREIAQMVPIAVLDRAPYGINALHGRFARQFANMRVWERQSAQLASFSAPAWIYLTIPRHPLSSTQLRKTLGRRAFLRHNAEL